MEQIVVLAGGLGTRMRPITEKIPKVMIPILERPFLEYQIELFKKNNLTNIVLCVGHLWGQIEQHFKDGSEFGVNIEYRIEKDKLLGTAGAVKNAEALLKDRFFVVNGDSYLPIDFQEVASYFDKEGKLGLDVVYKNTLEYHPNNSVIEGNLVTKYDKENPTPDMEYVDYGLMVFRKSVFTALPENEPCSLEGVFADLIAKKQLLAFETKQRFYEIGSAEGIKQFEEYLESKK